MWEDRDHWTPGTTAVTGKEHALSECSLSEQQGGPYTVAHTNQTACKAVEKHLEEVAQKRPASVRPAGERCGKPGTAGRAPQHSVKPPATRSPLNLGFTNFPSWVWCRKLLRTSKQTCSYWWALCGGHRRPRELLGLSADTTLRAYYPCQTRDNCARRRAASTPHTCRTSWRIDYDGKHFIL